MGRVIKPKCLTLFAMLLASSSSIFASDYTKEYSIEIDESETEGRQQSFKWGDFKVVFHESLDAQAYVQILGPKGDVLTTLQGPGFITPALFEDRKSFTNEFFLSLFKGREPLLKITTWSGGAYGYYVDRLYAQFKDGSVQELLRYEGGEGRIGKGIENPIIHDKDKTPHLVIIDYEIQKTGALQHGAFTKHVLSWNGQSFFDDSTRFKDVCLKQAIEFRTDIRAQLSDLSATEEVAVIGFLANSILANDEGAALSWLKSRFVSNDAFEDFKTQYLLKIRQSLKGFGSRLHFN